MSLCKATIIGNLGKDPELRYTADGVAVAKFSVACNRKEKDKVVTEWLYVSAFRGLAETCNKYLRKGSRVYIEGRLLHTEWETSDGKPRWAMEIVASEMQMVDAKEDRGEAPAGKPAEARDEKPADDLESLPF